jgi:hypothetical protein
MRLIALYPAPTKTSTLRAKLITIDLHSTEAVPYEALSYAWQGQKPSLPMLCDDLLLAITQNVDSALRRFRLTNRRRYLWIDAICINQEDLQEKSSQVSKLGYFFSTASKVLIWLGEFELPGERALKIFKHLSSTPDDTGQAVSVIAFRKWVEEEFDPDLLPTLEYILRQSWFKRRWIIQEVALSKRAAIYYGCEEIPFSVFVNAITRLRRAGFFTATYENDVAESMATVETLRQSFGFRPPILELLTIFSSHECLDDRDRIFAIQGLSQPQTKSTYEITPNEVTLNFAMDLASAKKAELLNCAGAYRPSFGHFSLEHPSWVPDWRCAPLYRPLIDIPGLSSGVQYTRYNEVDGIVDHACDKEYGLGYDSDRQRPSDLPTYVGKSSTGLYSSVLQSETIDQVNQPREYAYYKEHDSGCLETRFFNLRMETKETNTFLSVNGIRIGRAAHCFNVCQYPSPWDLYMAAQRSEFAEYPEFKTMTNRLSHPRKYLEEQSLPANGATTKNITTSLIETLNAVNGFMQSIQKYNPYRLQMFRERIWQTFSTCLLSNEANTLLDQSDSVPINFDSSEQGCKPEDFETVLRLVSRGDEKIIEFPSIFEYTMTGRCFVKLDTGHVGIVPKDTRLGDLAVIIRGARTPFILRPSETGRSFQLVGDCYIRGLMKGEVFGMDDFLLRSQEILLI